jgi:hypothetical protein
MQQFKANQGFWLYQSLGWSLFALVQLLVLTSDEALSLHNALPALLLLLLAFSGSLLLRCFWQRLSGHTVGSAGTLGYWLGSSLLLAVLLDIAHYWLLWPLAALHPEFAGLFDAQPPGAKVVLLWPLYLAWSALYLMLSRQQQLRHTQQLQQESELRLHQSQLQSLLAQLNPHFMFNCINNIRALILEDPSAARTMLAHFSDMLRYQIAADQQVLVPLRTELAVAEDYIALMKIQFEERLTFTTRVDPACLGLQLPKLTLQLLLENAIKHGINRNAEGGHIQLEVQMTNAPHAWTLTLRNTGRIQQSIITNAQSSSEPQVGTGLVNLRQRLKLLFGHAARVELQQQHDDVVATVTFSGPPLAALPSREPLIAQQVEQPVEQPREQQPERPNNR